VNSNPIFAWIAIGLAASLAVMILPFRRGTLGVVANLVAGGVGGPLGAVIGAALFPNARTGMRLGFAAIGAFVALAIVHFGWSAYTSSYTKRHQQHPSPR
jgi:uncharacterized membrane protein YeaQ/YmgE (transglycosylase-associated protein family)